MDGVAAGLGLDDWDCDAEGARLRVKDADCVLVGTAVDVLVAEAVRVADGERDGVAPADGEEDEVDVDERVPELDGVVVRVPSSVEVLEPVDERV